MKDPRPPWDVYFMRLATDVATRATCPRKHVGAVIVRDKRILSTGYNGSPRGMYHCVDVGCELKDMGGRQSCVRTIHAEANAIAQAALNGVSVEGATIYTTASPCYDCTKLILNSGIKKIVYGEFYDGRYGMSEEMVKFIAAAGATTYVCGPDEVALWPMIAPATIYKIIINSTPYETTKEMLTYAEIADIVYGLGRGVERTPTVTVKNNSFHRSLIRGEKVDVTSDLVINCLVTGSA